MILPSMLNRGGHVEFQRVCHGRPQTTVSLLPREIRLIDFRLMTRVYGDEHKCTLAKDASFLQRARKRE